MRIFGKKEKTEIPELSLVHVQESRKYNFFAALAKALLLFALIYGALGGFLSAFELDYNNGLCILVLFGLAMLLAAVYETEKRWLANLVIFLAFVAYLYTAVSNYWVINSGYYAILNRLYDVARLYLNVGDGVEYSLVVEETYSTVTMFALFLGMVGIILLNIMLQNKCSLFKVAALTLSFYIIPFYFDRSPGLVYILLLFTGYLTVAILQMGDVREKLSGQMCYILPLAAVVTILAVRTVSFILPELQYGGIVPKSESKAMSEERMAGFAQYGLLALMRQGSAGAGVSGGKLSKNAAVVPRNETVLRVRYTPYNYGAVYLKAFTGKDYMGDLWTEAENDLPDDGLMFASTESRMKKYEESAADAENGEGYGQGRGIMEVWKIDTTDRFEYQPYYTAGGGEVKQPGEPGNGLRKYVYFPDVDQTVEVTGDVSDVYLDVPESCRDAVARVCAEAGFSGTEDEIAKQIVNYFQDNYSYTLRPGYYYGNPDYISHFLLDSKRGYCAHFASAGTMLFRQMGIHARYVEGYAFSYYNVLERGELVEGAEYSDYYDGFAPVGETALIEMEIPDGYAHAWVEIYVEGRGWIVVDPTPSQTEQEYTASFWDAFMNGSSGDTTLEMSENNLGSYLESTLGGISVVLLVAAVLFLIGLAATHLRRAYRESRLPGRERVRLEYGRIQNQLGRKHSDYRRLRTIKEQIDWMRKHSRAEIDGQLEEILYQVYFAKNTDCDYEMLRKKLRRIRNSLRYGRVRPTETLRG